MFKLLATASICGLLLIGPTSQSLAGNGKADALTDGIKKNPASNKQKPPVNATSNTQTINLNNTEGLSKSKGNNGISPQKAPR